MTMIVNLFLTAMICGIVNSMNPEVMDDRLYQQKISEMDLQLQILRHLRVYAKRNQLENRQEPIVKLQMEEIGKAYSKALSDTSIMMLKEMEKEAEEGSVEDGTKKLYFDHKVDQENYLLEKTEVQVDILNSFQLGEKSYLLQLVKKPQEAEIVLVDGEDYSEMKRFPIKDVDLSNPEDYKINFKQISGAPATGNALHGTFYHRPNNTLFSYKLTVANSTFQDLKLLGKKELNLTDSITEIHPIKAKNANKILVFDRLAQALRIYSADIKRRDLEFVIPQNDSRGPVTSLLAQPNSVLLTAGSSVNFFKLTSFSLAPFNQSCVSDDEVTNLGYLPQNPGIMLTYTKDSIQLFEARGKGDRFSCKHKGEIYAPEGLEIDDVVFQAATNLIWLKFKGSKKVGIVRYDPKAFLKSLQLGQKVDPEDIYDLLEGKSILSLKTLGSDVLFETKPNVYTVLESTFTQKAQQTIASSSSDGGDKKKDSNPIYYMMPLAFMVVCYYQFYWKKSTPKGGMTDAEAKAYKNKNKSDKLGLGRLANFEEEITGKLNSQMKDQMASLEESKEALNQLKGFGGGEIANLQKEMADMKAQLSGMTDGAGGLTANLQKEMDAMKAEISGMTNQLSSQMATVQKDMMEKLGNVEDIKKMVEEKKLKKKKDQ